MSREVSSNNRYRFRDTEGLKGLARREAGLVSGVPKDECVAAWLRLVAMSSRIEGQYLLRGTPSAKHLAEMYDRFTSELEELICPE
tara:strand:+ start:2197 stop:2454 length:258 start_codon:yes stop_codon:yes gene_type:complete